MNLDFQAGGSPLAARTNPAIYAAILVALVIIAVFAVITLFIRFLKQKQQTEEWQESQKNRPTNKKDVVQFAQKYALSEAEKNILLKFCQKCQVPNILYSIKNFDSIRPFFKQYYDETHLAMTEKELNTFFNLRFKLGKIYASSVMLSSTKALLPKQEIAEVFHDGSKRNFTVFENLPDRLSIAIPEDFYNSEEKTPVLEKVAFVFKSQTGLRYAFVSRVIRYEQKDDIFLMVISHSTDLIVKQQRTYKRIPLEEKCRIASVQTETGKKGNTIYKHTENMFDCTVTNISGGGCCISATLPIKEGQLTYVEFPFLSETPSAIGKIVRTRRTKNQGVYNLHIQFRSISLEAQNKILAKVYGYN